MIARASLWSVIALLPLACSAVLGIDGLVADRAAGGDGAAEDGAGGDGAAQDGAAEGGGGGDGAAQDGTAEDGGCASTCGTPGCGACPKPRISSASFSIDAYEVTAAAYRAWLDTRPSLAGQRRDCAWNDSFEPGVVSPKPLALALDAGTPPDPMCIGWLEQQIASGDVEQPVVCADWCDAVAYCQWAKGHLCAAIGGASQTYMANQMPARGEWWSACSENGQHAYPYGPTFVKGTCNDTNSHIFDVGSFPACLVTGIFDMSGNVAEWEDSCSAFANPPEAQNCLRRGGAYWEGEAGLSCTSYREATRGLPDSNTGFRCCGPP